MRRFQILSISLAAGVLVVAASCSKDHEDESVPQTGNRPTNTTTTSTTVVEETTTTVEGGSGVDADVESTSTSVDESTETTVTGEETTTTSAG